KERLAAAGRPDEEQVVSASGRELEGPSGSGLTADLGEVSFAQGDAWDERGSPRWSQHGFTPEVPDHLAKRRGHAHVHLGAETGFHLVLRGHDGEREPTPSSALDEGQGAADGPESPVERQLADQQDTLERVRGKVTGGREDGRGDRDVEGASRLPEVGRGQVDGDRVLVEEHVERGESARDAHPRFAHHRLGEAHHLEEGRTARAADLHADWMGFETQEHAAVSARDTERRAMQRSRGRESGAWHAGPSVHARYQLRSGAGGRASGMAASGEPWSLAGPSA